MLLGACGGGGGGGSSAPTAPPIAIVPAVSVAPAPPDYTTDPRYGTRYYDASLTSIAPQIYVDPFNGSDAADGTTRATALKTKAGLLAHPLMGVAGRSVNEPSYVRNLTIGIVGHATQKLREQFNFQQPSDNNGFRVLEACSLVRVGANPVLGDCTDVASPAQFYEAGRSFCYMVDWAHDFSDVGVCRFRVFINDKPLKRVKSAADLTPGTYWYAGEPEVRTAKTILFRDYDDSDPRTNGKIVEITRREVVISLAGGMVQGIWGQRNGHNSGSFIVHRNNRRGQIPSQLRGVLAIEGTKHCAVFGHGEHIDLFAVNCRDDDYDPGGEICIMLTLAEDDLNGQQAMLTRCHAVADTTIWGSGFAVGQNSSHGFLTHDTREGGGLTSLEAADCSNIGLAGGWNFGYCAAAKVTRFYSPSLTATVGAAAHLSIETGRIDVLRSFIGTGRTLFRWVTGANVAVSNSLLLTDHDFSSGGVSTLYRPGSVTVSDTFMIASVVTFAPAIENSTGGGISCRRNVFANTLNTFVSTNAPGGSSTVDSDDNTHLPPPTSTYFCYSGTAEYGLAQWQGLSGQDRRSTQVDGAAALGFRAGALPSVTAPDASLTAGGRAAQLMTEPFTNQEVADMRRRPATLEQIKAYLLNAPSLKSVTG